MLKSNSAKELTRRNIDIILVSTQVPENIGLAARVLKNTGFSNLTLVNPNLTSKSYEVAKRARDLLEKARVVKTLREAIKGCHFVFGTTRRRREYKIIHNFSDVKVLLTQAACKKRVGIVENVRYFTAIGAGYLGCIGLEKFIYFLNLCYK